MRRSARFGEFSWPSRGSSTCAAERITKADREVQERVNAYHSRAAAARSHLVAGKLGGSRCYPSRHKSIDTRPGVRDHVLHALIET